MAEQNLCVQYWELLKNRNNICVTSRESVKRSIIDYDVKDEVGYDGDDWQRMCRYKTADDDFDCDVALLMVLQYAIAFPFVLSGGRTIEEQYYYKGVKYELRADKSFAFRGDTMNSYATTVHKFVSLFSSRSGRISARVILENYDAFSSLLTVEAKKFIRICHTTGNFIPVPFVKRDQEFNSPRGGWPTKDYWDWALRAIYQWYTSQDDTRLKEMLEKDENVDLCKQWLEVFGKGTEGWKKFVHENYMEPFVHDDYGAPKALWEGHLDEGAEVLPQKQEEKGHEQEQFKQFFENSTQWIVKRGELIAEAILQELEKVPGCHPWKVED